MRFSTDASSKQLGAVITQDNRPITFFSRKLSDTQRKYIITEIELLAIVKTLKELKGMLWGQHIKVFTDHANLMRDALGLTLDRVYRWRFLLEEYGPEIFYIKGIHNTAADAVSRLEYDPSVNKTAESFHMTKVRSRSHQRQCWATVSKNWCKLDVDSENLDSYTNKHDDWNLVFAHHEEEEEVYSLTLTEVADAQRKDQELKAYFKKNAIMHHKDMGIQLIEDTKVLCKKEKSNNSNISLSKGSEMVPPLPPTPWALTPRGEDEIRDVLERYAYYHLETCQILQILPSK